MTIFAVTYRYSDDVATRDALRTEHRDYLRGLADRGLLLVSGPFGADEAPGALLLFRADDKAHVDALVEKDPSPQRGDRADRHHGVGTGDRPQAAGSHRRPARRRRLADIGHQRAVQHRCRSYPGRE